MSTSNINKRALSQKIKPILKNTTVRENLLGRTFSQINKSLLPYETRENQEKEQILTFKNSFQNTTSVINKENMISLSNRKDCSFPRVKIHLPMICKQEKYTLRMKSSNI